MFKHLFPDWCTLKFCCAIIFFMVFFMQSGIVATLVDRFKDKRRERKPKSSKASTGCSAELESQRKVVPRPHKPFALPPIPDGEDTVSFERHNRVLQSEWTKSSRNAVTIEQLMERTFPMRRRDILEESADVQATFNRYPFLQDPDQVLEMHLPFSCIY